MQVFERLNIQSWKKNASGNEHELKLKRHNKH